MGLVTGALAALEDVLIKKLYGLTGEDLYPRNGIRWRKVA